jgi:hypothetical protein
MTFGTYEQRRAPELTRASQRGLRVLKRRTSQSGNDADEPEPSGSGSENLRVRAARTTGFELGRTRHQALEQRSSDRRAEAAAKAQDAASETASFGWESLSASAE